MRGMLAISAIGHLAVVAFASIAFPDAKPFAVEPIKAVPVEFVSASELTRLKAGEKKPDLKEPPEVKKAAEEEPPKPKAVAALPPEPQPRPEAPKTAAAPAAAPRPQTRKAPAEPPEPEPVPAPKKSDEPKAEEAEKKPPKQASVPMPSLRPAHVPTPRPKKKQEFDPDQIAALLNKVPDSQNRPKRSDAPGRADKGDPRGLDDRMSLSELDALRAQISRCWSPPVGVQGAAELAIRLQLALNQDGTLVGPPKILTQGSGLAFLAAADSARRAVLRCQPYDLPLAKYDAWRDIKVNFDPREMLGG